MNPTPFKPFSRLIDGVENFRSKQFEENRELFQQLATQIPTGQWFQWRCGEGNSDSSSAHPLSPSNAAAALPATYLLPRLHSSIPTARSSA